MAKTVDEVLNEMGISLEPQVKEASAKPAATNSGNRIAKVAQHLLGQIEKTAADLRKLGFTQKVAEDAALEAILEELEKDPQFAQLSPEEKQQLAQQILAEQGQGGPQVAGGAPAPTGMEATASLKLAELDKMSEADMDKVAGHVGENYLSQFDKVATGWAVIQKLAEGEVVAPANQEGQAAGTGNVPASADIKVSENPGLEGSLMAEVSEEVKKQKEFQATPEQSHNADDKQEQAQLTPKEDVKLSHFLANPITRKAFVKAAAKNFIATEKK